jgi:hypothetical protein
MFYCVKGLLEVQLKDDNLFWNGDIGVDIHRLKQDNPWQTEGWASVGGLTSAAAPGPWLAARVSGGCKTWLIPYWKG